MITGIETKEGQYAHNPPTKASLPRDLTKYVRQTFHRKEGQPPTVILYEREDSVGPPLSSITEKMARITQQHYELQPEQIIWYEKPLNGDFVQVKFKSLGQEANRPQQWCECKRVPVKEEDIARAIGKEFMYKQDLSQVQQRDQNKDFQNLSGAPLEKVFTVEQKLEQQQTNRP